MNHNGREDLALQLVDAAADCGADAVKFQTFSADRLVRKGAPAAEYQTKNTGFTDQYDLLKSVELDEAAHGRIASRCAELGIEFMSTAFDEEAANLLDSLGMRRFKVPSGELTNEPFLAHLARVGKELIVSTGMATMDEIHRAVEVIATARQESGILGDPRSALTILHCTSNYPAALEDVNLRAMRTIAEETDLPVGYSDHTEGIDVACAAVAMGASVIEKHFTLDRNLSGPDHKASLSVSDLRTMIANIRRIESALGSAHKGPSASEQAVRELVRRSVTTVRDIAEGAAIQGADLVLLRPGTGIPPRDLHAVAGRIARKSIPAGTTLTWDDVA